MSEQPQTQQSEQSGLTVQDLSLMLQVIQAATARGAIKPEELSIVGNLYDRVYRFLDAIGAVNKAANTQDETPAQPAEESKPKVTKGKKQ